MESMAIFFHMTCHMDAVTDRVARGRICISSSRRIDTYIVQQLFFWLLWFSAHLESRHS